MTADFVLCDGDLSAEGLAIYLRDPYVAVDTETMGLVLGRDRLCLVQLCNPEGLVTTIRIPQGSKAAPNLECLLTSPTVEKIFHFARFDLATLQVNLGIPVAPIFCTKVGSKLARTYTSKHGLKELIQELCGVELDKSAQSSDWGSVSDLSEKQLSYAANDVRYLIPARLKLESMLRREARWDLAQHCFACIPTLVELDILGYSNTFEHNA